MLTDVVRIGNSKGIRIPAVILKECNIKDKVEMEVKDGKIIIKPVDNARKGWDESFKAMRANNDDNMIIEENTLENIGDWEW